jgi:uncharacterized membrane protein YkvA (DUF1232 family)
MSTEGPDARKALRKGAAGTPKPAATTRWWNRRPSRSRAEQYAREPALLKALWAEARGKSRHAPRGPFGDAWAYLMTMIRLLKVYAGGGYRKVSWQSLVTTVFAVLYFVSPFDLVPDFIPGGLVDDALIVTLALRSVKNELDAFLEWESAQEPDRAPDTNVA